MKKLNIIGVVFLLLIIPQVLSSITDVTDYLVYYKMETNTSNNAIDETNDHNGTTVGTSIETGYYNNGYGFNGDNQQVNIGTFNVSDNYEFSVYMWIKHNTLTGLQTYITEQPINQRWFFGINGGSILLRGGALGSDLNYVPSFSLNTWYTVVGIFNNTEGIIYVDGVEKARGAINKVVLSNTNDILIGMYSGSGGDLNAISDDVRVYDRILSLIEINQIGYCRNPTLSTWNPKASCDIDTETISTSQLLDIEGGIFHLIASDISVDDVSIRGSTLRIGSGSELNVR